jgi:hypothetical protein
LYTNTEIIKENYLRDRLRQETISCYLLKEKVSNSLQPINWLVNQINGSVFYTVDENEKNTVIAARDEKNSY